MDTINQKKKMEFISLGQPSRDRIHATYNGKIVAFYGEIGEAGFSVYANSIEWYPEKPATITEKIQIMREANQTFHGSHRLFFVSNNLIYFDLKGNPLIQVQNDKIIAEEFPCVCSILKDIPQFQDEKEYEMLQFVLSNYILLKLLKKKLIPIYYKKHWAHRYICPFCGTTWVLVEPNMKTKGFFIKKSS